MLISATRLIPLSSRSNVLLLHQSTKLIVIFEYSTSTPPVTDKHPLRHPLGHPFRHPFRLTLGHPLRHSCRLFSQSAPASMIDGHCHISAFEFDDDRDKLLQDAKLAGVQGIIGVPEFPGDFQPLMSLSEAYKDFIYPCIGVHPVQSSAETTFGDRSVTMEDYEQAEKFIRENHEKIVGIGEIGLDFTPRYIKSPEDKEIQREVFRRQIRLAKEYDLPVNVHSRSAGRPVIDLLIEEGAQKVLLHAFDGKVSVMKRGVLAGFYFSVPPCIVRSDHKQKLAKEIPLSHLLLETDAPALGPEKQGRNEPPNLRISRDEVARIKGVTPEEVAAQTSANAATLFSRIKWRPPPSG